MGNWTDETLQRKSEEFTNIAQLYMLATSDELAKEYARLYEQVDEEEIKLHPIKQRLSVVKTLLADKFAEEDKKSVKFENGARVSVRFTTPFSVKDKDAFIAWLKANDMESELTVSAARCASIAKNLYEEANTIPDGLVAGDPLPVVTYLK